MKLRAMKRFLGYDVFDSRDEQIYTVKGPLAWGFHLRIYNMDRMKIGTVKQRVLTWNPKFDLYLEDRYMGSVTMEISFRERLTRSIDENHDFRNAKFLTNINGWYIDDDWYEGKYSIRKENGQEIAAIFQEGWRWKKTDVIKAEDSQDALLALMIVLVINKQRNYGKV